MIDQSRRRRERLLEAAEGYLALHMPDHALRQLNAVSDPQEGSFIVHQLRGEALRQQGKYQAALGAYHRALAEMPPIDNAIKVSLLLGMAWCYKRTDQLDQSIAVTQQAYEAAPDEPIILYNLACYFALAGDKPQALSWLGRALRMEQSLHRLIAQESDFARLRNDPDFQFIADAHKVSDLP